VDSDQDFLEVDLKRTLRDYALLLLIAGIIIGFDQWTKVLVRTKLEFGGIWAPWDWLLPYARIVHWNNSGAAFGILQGQSLLFTILAFLVTGVIIYYFPRVSPHDWTLRLAMGLQLGGAMGNLIDRLTMKGQVTDFISVGSFAVFNVADASITVGVAILLIGVWIKELQDRKVSQSVALNNPVPVNGPMIPDAIEDEKQAK
jgi:signal peptidase II